MKLLKIYKPLWSLMFIIPILFTSVSCGHTPPPNRDPTKAPGFQSFLNEVTQDTTTSQEIANNIINPIPATAGALESNVHKYIPNNWKLNPLFPRNKTSIYTKVDPAELQIFRSLKFDKATSNFTISLIDMWDVQFPNYINFNTIGTIKQVELFIHFNAKTDSGKTYDPFKWNTLIMPAPPARIAINDWEVFQNYGQWESPAATLANASAHQSKVSTKALNNFWNNTYTLNYEIDSIKHSITKKIAVFGKDPKEVTVTATWSSDKYQLIFEKPIWTTTKIELLNTNNAASFYQAAVRENINNIITKSILKNNKLPGIPSNFSTNSQTLFTQTSAPHKIIAQANNTNSKTTLYCSISYNIMFHINTPISNHGTNFIATMSIHQTKIDQKYQISDWVFSNFKFEDFNNFILNIAKFGNRLINVVNNGLWFMRFIYRSPETTYPTNKKINLWPYYFQRNDIMKQDVIQIGTPDQNHPFISFQYDDTTLHLLFTITFNDLYDNQNNFSLTSVTYET